MAGFVVLVLIVIFPFLFFNISTQLFYRKVNSAAVARRPPTIPYFVPGIFHAFALAYQGPQKYFAALIKQYAHYPLFVVKAGLSHFVVLRHPGHIKKATLTPGLFSRYSLHIHTYEKLFDFPKEVIQIYKSVNKGKSVVEHAHVDLPRKYLTDSSLAQLTDIYITTLSRSLHDKMFQFDTWTQIEDFWSFSQQVVTRCATETLLGSNVFKQYPSLVKDYWKFNDAVDGFMPGLPRFPFSGAFEGPRDRMLQGIEKWLKANHGGSDFAKISDDDPIWDEYLGSKFIQERDGIFAKTDNVTLRARAAEMMSVIHRSNSKVLPISFWTIIEILRNPHLSKRVAAEINPNHSRKSGEYDIVHIANAPLIQSICTEIRRLRTCDLTIRIGAKDRIVLDQEWALDPGMNIVTFSHDVALNTDYWAKARPGSVERPLEEFYAERFLISDRLRPMQGKARQTNERREVGRFGMEGLETFDSLLDDSDMIVGRDFVQTMQVATLAVFLAEFELQLCDAEAVDAAMPPLREVAFGTIKPTEEIAIRIRKRRLGDRI